MMQTAIRMPLIVLSAVVLFTPACVESSPELRGASASDAAPAGSSGRVSQATESVPVSSTDGIGSESVESSEVEGRQKDGASDDRISFKLGLEPGDMLYYVIESEHRESGGVPPLLSYSTVIKDRKTISQKVMPRSIRQATTAEAEDDPLMTLLWKVERYEVTEQGMKDTVSFDSVRHLYPPPTLWELGGISGSRTTFFIDPNTGHSEGWSITPGKTAGESYRRPLSKLAAKCQLTNDNLAALLHDLGPYWMPEAPVEIGETWTRTYSEDLRTFGKKVTTLNCVLQSVRKIGDRRIARVELSGDVTLEPPPQPTTRPGQPARAGQQREFRVERSTCKGTVEFDLIRGEVYTLNLHRELHLTAEVESERTGTMELKTGWGHILKVKTGHTPPPKPIIVGGPKPPEVPDEDKPSRTPVRRPPSPGAKQPMSGSSPPPPVEP